jgi:hypothetical protein
MTHKELVEFTEQIANLKNERETEGGLTWEDSVETINSLIAEARKLTGIDPQYPLIGECYCCKEDCPICSKENE